ncbi:uncharacterized protein LOC124674192 isoform X2 [Lolium rigidum]|uniref:uncharacterized protein LOC124674192 isoform X2 n=1 Tax=Lolium rigidum TaxID=89674 RepID=UPI001F5CEDFA|nr:uncharacterized protein LOC124674192 isoform X2 [Lolium rigidum]
MAADSSMGFHHQGITATAASVYSNHHHMLSFQSSSDAASMGGAAGMGFVAPRSMSERSSTAAMYLSPNNNTTTNNNTGAFGNTTASRTSSSGGSTTASKYKFVTGSPSEWSDRELSILKDGLVRFAREPKIMRYIKIAATLPNRTIRDVALRCWWSTGKDRRKKPDGFSTGKKLRDMKPMQDQMVASAPMANFHMTPTNSLTPFSISMQSPNQQCQVPKEAAVVDSATQQLLEQNNQLLNQIAANIDTLKTEENAGLFLQTNNNIRTILTRMSETAGIMGHMPPLPTFVHEEKLDSLLQVDRLVQSYGAAHAAHMKQEP